MITACRIWTVLLLGFCCTERIWGLPASTFINCETSWSQSLSSIDEGYAGELEVVKVPKGVELTLESPSCPVCLSFVELNYAVGDLTAVVRTRKPLDAEALREYGGHLSYAIVCVNNGVVNNRTLVLTDINDHAPVFDKDPYRVQISETLAVGSLVVQVKAVDADISPVYNSVNYSIEPPSDTFEVKPNGSILLKKQLNYTVTSSYKFSVTAKDIDGNSDETTVVVNVRDGPYFEYSAYNATVPENEVGPLQNITPAPIKAYGEEHNQTIMYSISTVNPSEYWENFAINNNTGVITVRKELDHEKTFTMSLNIQASLQNGSNKTADAEVMVRVEDVNEPPVFTAEVYTAQIYSVVPAGFPVVQVKATDPDVGESEKLQYSLLEPSSTFAVEPSSGRVYVVSAAGESGTVTLQVKATDPHGLYDTTTVEVTIKESQQNNVVKISLNKPFSTVMNNAIEMEEALQKALRWTVKIIGIRVNDVSQDLPLTRDSSHETNVDFIAQSGSELMSRKEVETRLVSEQEKVLTELRAVFGLDVDFDIVGPELPITEIVLGTLLPLICIGGILLGVMVQRKKSPRRNSNDSMNDMPTFQTWEPGSQLTLHRATVSSITGPSRR